jgi:hypothetical protein
MPIHYILVPAKNPKTGEQGKRASVKRHYRLEGAELVRRLVDGTTVSEEDASAVQIRLGKIVINEVLLGNSVYVAGLGTLQAQMTSGLIKKDKDFNPLTGIRRLRIKFRPDPSLRKALKQATFAPYESHAA